MKSFLKKYNNLFLVCMFIVGMGTLPFANAQTNPDCPNGCLTRLGECYCYGTHAYQEATWPVNE